MRTLTLVAPGDLLTATGGYEYDRRVLEGLQDLGWAARVLSLDSSFPTPSVEALRDAHWQLATLPAGSLVMIDGLALGAMPDIVHAHKDRLCMVGLVHHPLAAETGLTPDLVAQLFESERRALGAMRHVVVTSQSTQRALTAYGVASDRIAVVEPGVDLPAITQLQAEERLYDATAPVRMLCVATITPRKGHDLLVHALSSLRNLSWTLTCVGNTQRSPATARALSMQIEALKLENRIVLTGEIDEAGLHRDFRSADLFVLATHFEGYGMAVAQALAHGLPIVSTRTGAIEALVPTDAGLLVEPGNGTALRDALSQVLADPNLRQSLAAGARVAGSGLASWSAASQRLSAVLAGVAHTIGECRALR